MGAHYEVKLSMDEYEDGSTTWLVSVPAFPEITTYGDTTEEALNNALGAIEEAIAGRIYRHEDITPFRKPDGLKHSVQISLLVAMKASIYMVCRIQDVSRAELARRMGTHRQQVDRLFDVNHKSQVEQFDGAARALGLTIDISELAA